jgi:hypothetical protein
MSSNRRSVQTAALGFTAIQWRAADPTRRHHARDVVDHWRGVGAVVGGMRRLGYDVQMKQVPDGVTSQLSRAR